MQSIPNLFFLTALVLITVSFFYLLWPFAGAILFALLFAHFFKKPHQKFVQWGGKRFSALLSTGCVFLIFILPLSLIIVLLSLEAQAGYKKAQLLAEIGIGEFSALIRENAIYLYLKETPFFAPLQEWIASQTEGENLGNAIKGALNAIFNFIKATFVNLTSIFVSFAVVLYLFYFLIGKGGAFLAYVNSFIPLQEKEKERFVQESLKIIDATLIGTLFIGLLEGSFGGLLFYYFEVPSPVTWGLVMFVLSMIPVLGTNGILFPFAIYQLVIGNYGNGFLVLVLGCGGILASQNLLKPKLMGDRSGLHPALIVLSSLGGIIWMGVIGFIIGPAIATLFLVFWQQVKERVEKENAVV